MTALPERWTETDGSPFGTVVAAIFVQGFLIEGLRFLGDWRNLLFGALIVLAMNVRPKGFLDAPALQWLKRQFGGKHGPA